MSEPQVKTEEKKQHFDDIYVAETPVPFKERIIDALDYISDDFNRQTFDRLILPWAQQQADAGKTLNYVDLCCCFGNTTMAACTAWMSRRSAPTGPTSRPARRSPPRAACR